jgi:hypothetical protein
VIAKLYVEGGGNSKSLRTACRAGFRKFLERAGLTGRMPRIVVCGGRQDAYDSFVVAQSAGDGTPGLLVDAEGPITTKRPWEHLQSKDGWNCPGGAEDDQCHLMVQVMESWFLADRQTLASYYGHLFNANALPANPDIEGVSKQDVLRGLDRATSNTRKGTYSKGQHSFEILASLAPAPVEAVSPYAKRLLDTLRAAASFE